MSTIDKLLTVRKQIAELELQELGYMQSLIDETKHDKLGQATYTIDGRKITIKTGENVRLDKAILNATWVESMPINRSYSYTLRQKDYEAIMKSGSPAQRKQLAEIVTTAPAKPSIKVEL